MKRTRKNRENQSLRKHAKSHEAHFSATLLPSFAFNVVALNLPVPEILLGTALVCKSWHIGSMDKGLWEELKKRDVGERCSVVGMEYRMAIRCTFGVCVDNAASRLGWMRPSSLSFTWSPLPESLQLRRKSTWLLLTSAQVFMCGGCKANVLLHNMQLIAYFDQTTLINIVDLSYEQGEAMPQAKMSVPVVEMEGQVFAFGGISNNGWALTADRFEVRTKTWHSLPDTPAPILSYSPVLYHSSIYLVTEHSLEQVHPQSSTYRCLLLYLFSAHNLCWLSHDELYIAHRSLTTINLRSLAVRERGMTTLRIGMWWTTTPMVVGGKVYIGQKESVLCLDMRTEEWTVAVEAF